jgi:hypothetical protein
MRPGTPICRNLEFQLDQVVQEIRRIDGERRVYEEERIRPLEERIREAGGGGAIYGWHAQLDTYRSILARLEIQRRQKLQEFDRRRLDFQRRCGVDYPLPFDIER